MAHRFGCLLFLVGVLFAGGCRHGRCYRDSDCHKELVCLDPDFKAAPAKRCAKDEVRCVAGCQARCTADSCDDDKVCGESGCCEAKACKLNNDCPRDESCIDNKCTAPGNCMEPAVEPTPE